MKITCSQSALRGLVKRVWLVMATIAIASNGAAAAASYKKGKLPGGLETVALEDHKVPLITIVLTAKAGSMTETIESSGLTHLWEHMFFKGNKLLANQEAFNRRVRELGMIFNGDTSPEKVRYYFTLPSVFLEQGLEFMANAIRTPLLEQNELERERHVVLNEYDRDASQPGFDLYRLKRKILYGSKGYLRDPLGERHIIEKATREQLLAIKEQVFVPSNSCLLVAGDFDPAELSVLINKYFGDWRDPQGWRPPNPPPFPSFPPSQEVVMTHDEAKNVSVVLVYDGPKARTAPKDSFAADMLSQLLDLRSGRFHQKFVESGLSIASGVGYYTQSQTGEVNIFALAQPEKAIKVKQLLAAEPKHWLEKDYFTEEQLADIKRRLTVEHKLQVNKPSEYINTLAFWWAITGFDYYDSYIENLQKTTLDDVHAFVAKYLAGKPYLTTVFLSPADAKNIGLKDNSASFPPSLLER